MSSTDPATAVSTLEERAVALAGRWVSEAAAEPTDAAAARLPGVLRDPRTLDFAAALVDGVLRPESLGAAASQLRRLAADVPDALPWQVRGAVQLAGAVAPALPSPIVPLARRALREIAGHLVVDARPEKLAPALAELREGGTRLNLDLLGEAVLGEAEATRRLDGILDLARRPDVDQVSVRVSAIAARISMWALDDIVDRVVERLLPLYLAAADAGTLVDLDMEEYRDLDLTIAVFTRLLEDPRLTDVEAGIVLPASLPDALPAFRELAAWARLRVRDGGARIRVRLVTGANLAMERADAIVRGWTPATYDSALDVDANRLRLLDEALRPEITDAMRIGVAGHDLFDIAHAWELAGERGVRDAVEVELPLGLARGHVAAVAREVGAVLLRVPAARPEAMDIAIGDLVRRLAQNASTHDLLPPAADLAGDAGAFARQRDHYLAAVARAADPSLPTGANRTQDRTSVTATPPITRAPASADAEDGYTQAVLGIARAASDASPVDADARSVLFGGQAFVETAVFAPREQGAADGAPGFRNAADSDPALPANREWAGAVLGRVPASRLGEGGIAEARVENSEAVGTIVSSVRDAAVSWGARPAAERAAVLREAARVLQERRGRLIEVAAAETGKVFAEADAEVSEAVDFANYYAATAGELDRTSGAVFVPARVTVVTPPANSPLGIPAGGVLAALAAGSGVVLTPAPRARRCAAVLADALWAAGVPRKLLALADAGEGELARTLIEHTGVDRVLLTGSWETARLFRSWRPDLDLRAQTGGKNAIIVTPSADLDLAASDLVRSAFGHAGQKRSAASLAILVGPVARSRRFAQQLVDATTSLRVGPASDPLSEMGPLIEAPQGSLAWALRHLGEGERWLVQPRELDFGDDPDNAGRYWTPGIRTGVRPGSRFHREEFLGPVLGIMHASSLAHAIELQNAVDGGLTAGLHTRHPDDLALWLDRVHAGNLYVNRPTTGAIVQRQPFGGWKRSSVGPGAKVGGPNYLVGLGSWRASAGGPASSTLHLRGLDSRMTALIESAQPTLGYEAFEWLRRGALSDAIAWDREFGRVKDVTGLGVERNLLRYRPADVAVRATGDAPWQAVLRVVLAGVRSGSTFGLSLPVGLPAEVRRALGEAGVAVSVETDEQWLERMTGVGDLVAADGSPTPRPARARLVGSAESVALLRRALAEAVNGDPDLAVYADEVTTAGRLELLPFLHEQSISITAHRYGTPDRWSEEVI